MNNVNILLANDREILPDPSKKAGTKWQVQDLESGGFELRGKLPDIRFGGERDEFASGFPPMWSGQLEHDFGSGGTKFAEQMQNGH